MPYLETDGIINISRNQINTMLKGRWECSFGDKSVGSTVYGRSKRMNHTIYLDIISKVYWWRVLLLLLVIKQRGCFGKTILIAKQLCINSTRFYWWYAFTSHPLKFFPRKTFWIKWRSLSSPSVKYFNVFDPCTTSRIPHKVFMSHSRHFYFIHR